MGAVEGTRPLMVEVQALVSRTAFGMPRRQMSGVDYNRTLLLIAVLDKRCGLHLESQDVYVNVTGGLEVTEPAADLGIACAMASAYREKPVDSKTVWIGEVGLGGELRPVGQLADRLNEACKLGFRRAVVPKQAAANSAWPRKNGSGQPFDVQMVSTVSEALERF